MQSVRFSRITLVLITAFALMGAGSLAAQEEAVGFLQLGSRALESSPAAVDAVQVQVDTKPLESFTRLLSVELFDGKQHRIEGYEVEERGPGDLAWRGRFEDGGQAVLTVKNGYVVGILYSPDGVYELTTSKAGQILQRLDQSAFPPCAHEDEHKGASHDFGLGGDAGASAGKPVAGTPGLAPEMISVIDVMSLYTPAARNGAGGTAAIQAVAQNAIDVSNTAFTNSQTNAQFNLVHVAEISYSETGNIQTDRNWLRNNATANSLRDQFAADLVGLLVENGGGFCGIAFLMGNEDPAAFAPNGYQVTARNCAVGNLSYPHEHGHNLGLQHNPQNGAPSSQAIYPWSYGHYINGNYRTVMSYSSQCPSGCTRQPYFSNPGVSFQGAATGIANQRDNSRTIDLIAPITANYRSGGGGTPGNCDGTNCIDWDTTANVSYSTQDQSGTVSIQNGGDTILLQNNTWRRTTQTFTVTANTVLEVEFSSTSQGEIHGIGFDENDNISDATRVFQLHGTQTWGSANQTYNNYSSGTTTYTIPVGQFYTGSNMRLVLVNDNDAGSGNTSSFTNVRVYEDGGGTGGTCSVDTDFSGGAAGWTTSGSCSTGTFVLGTPSQQTNSGVTTQVGGDHTTGSGNALFTATNSSAGNADVDGGECVVESPSFSVSVASDLSIWYFHGQRDSGDDAGGDYFVLEVSTNGGSSYSSIVSIGDTQTNAAWTEATASIPAGSNVRVRVRVSDGAGPGDLIEGGIDDLSICTP